MSVTIDVQKAFSKTVSSCFVKSQEAEEGWCFGHKKRREKFCCWGREKRSFYVHCTYTDDFTSKERSLHTPLRLTCGGGG